MKKIFLLLLFLTPFALVAQQGINFGKGDAEYLATLANARLHNNVLFENDTLGCIFITSIVAISLILFILLIFYRKRFFSLYSVEGRATRETFWVWWILDIPFFIFYLIFFSVWGNLILYLQENGISPYLICIPLVITFILFYIPYICVQIRRLHDMNISGSWYILCLLINHTPLVIIKWIIFGFIPGTRGVNKYGEIVSKEKKESSYEIRNYFQKVRTKLSSKNIANKKAFVISFIVGLIFGIMIIYAISNRYESYPSNGSIIIRIDKWTGTTEMANTRSSYPQWHKIDEGL